MRLVSSLHLLAFVMVAAACDALSPGAISTGSDGLRTFSYQQSVGGAPILCTLEGATDPVVGNLAGDITDRERVWLQTGDGLRLSIVWPGGFTVRFAPGAVLYNEAGRPVARAGDEIEFGQVNFGEHAGTFADPYFAREILLGGVLPATALSEASFWRPRTDSGAR